MAIQFQNFHVTHVAQRVEMVCSEAHKQLVAEF